MWWLHIIVRCKATAMFVCLSFCVSTCVSVYLCVCLSVCLSICVSVYLCVCLSVCLSICLAAWLMTYIMAYKGPWTGQVCQLTGQVCQLTGKGHMVLGRTGRLSDIMMHMNHSPGKLCACCMTVIHYWSHIRNSCHSHMYVLLRTIWLALDWQHQWHWHWHTLTMTWLSNCGECEVYKSRRPGKDRKSVV